jgi:hypothetical protein
MTLPRVTLSKMPINNIKETATFGGHDDAVFSQLVGHTSGGGTHRNSTPGTSTAKRKPHYAALFVIRESQI